jgi:hypothetical protein
MPGIKDFITKLGGRKGDDTSVGSKYEDYNEVETFKDPNKLIRPFNRSRSQSPSRRGKPRHLPNSRASKGEETLRKTIREHPSFEDLRKRPELDGVMITRKQYEQLQDDTGSCAKDVISETDLTGWELLINPIAYQTPIQNKSNTNSPYDNTKVFMEDLRLWEEFPDYTDIKNFIQQNLRLRQLFHEVLLDNAGSGTLSKTLFNASDNIPANEENSLARNLHAFFSQLSTLIRLACQGLPGHQGVTQNSLWVAIGGGKCAMKRRSEGNPGPKVPDLVAYWSDGDSSHLNAKKGKPHPATDTNCLIVGDFKMNPKFSHSMLLKKKGEFDAEGSKVVNQIHDYMDMHQNKYGYIITHTELIMFRRRDNPPKWGQLDFSPSIPVSAERGELNAMMVLWYFHVRYAVMEDDGGWELPSYYHLCPKDLLGSSVKKSAKKA